jgi:bacteriorhodopsin
VHGFGRTVLAITFIALSIATAIFVFKGATSRFVAQRKYLFINTYIAGVSAICYFAMLSGEGFKVLGSCREFYWARYVDLAITGSLVVLELGMLVNMEEVLVFSLMGCNVISAFAGYAASSAAGHGSAVKWFWYILSVMMLFPILFSLWTSFRERIANMKPPVPELYNTLLWIVTVCFSAFAIIWLICIGLGSLQVDLEVLFNAVFDLGLKALLGFVFLHFLSASEQLPPENFYKG